MTTDINEFYRTNKIDHNFDEYPPTRQYYVSPNSIEYTDKQRAYHHYETSGKKLGYFCNAIDKQNINDR